MVPADKNLPVGSKNLQKAAQIPENIWPTQKILVRLRKTTPEAEQPGDSTQTLEI